MRPVILGCLVLAVVLAPPGLAQTPYYFYESSTSGAQGLTFGGQTF